MMRCFLIILFLISFTEIDSLRADETGVTSRALVLAHYMPWYAAKPSSDEWGWHWTMNHFDPEQRVEGKREIASKFSPLIGPYDSGDVDVIEFHLLTMKLAGIDGVIVDWYGMTDFRDYPMLNRNTFRLLQQCERLKMKFVICYEDQTVPALVEGGKLGNEERVSHVQKEINWLCQYWFKSPSYVRFENKPVLLSFGHAGLTDKEWSRCLQNIERPVLYYSQDIRREAAVGGFGWPSPQRGLSNVDDFLTNAKDWPDSIPVAFPRFDDIYSEAMISEGYPVIPDNQGRTFQTTFKKAIDSNPRIIQIATWNDWGEGTHIEPSQEYGYRDLEWIQKVRGNKLEPEFETKPSDLRLPRQLLELRRAGKKREEELLNKISENLSELHVESARRALRSL